MSSHHDSDQLGQRIRALVDHHVPDEVRAGHLAAIDAELAHQLTAISNEPTIRLPARWRARRWLASLAATATLLTPGIAVAAHDAVPGDTLYGVKRATEHVHRLVIPDVAARNRVAELAALLDRDTPPDILAAASDAARDAVAALPDDHPLHEQLAALLARIPNQPGGDATPPPPTNSVTDDEREPDDEDADDDQSEPDGLDGDDGDTDDGEHGDDLDNDTDDVEDGDDLDDGTDEPDQDDGMDESDQDVEQDNHEDDTDDEHDSHASSTEYTDGSDEDDGD